MIDSDQNEISQYLKSWPGQFVSRREICRRAGGKWRYREDEHWAVPVLQRMVESGLVETNSTGHYRLIVKSLDEAKDKKRVWISPAIRTILQKSGRTFPVLELDKAGDPNDWSRLTSQPTYQLDD